MPLYQKEKWKRLFRSHDGHTFFTNSTNARSYNVIAIADESIRRRNRPDLTDDGLLLVSVLKPMTLITERSGSNFRLPLTRPDGEETSTIVSFRAAIQIAHALRMILMVGDRTLVVT